MDPAYPFDAYDPIDGILGMSYAFPGCLPPLFNSLVAQGKVGTETDVES